MIFVTGAAGFIGSNFVHHLASKGYDDIIILDKLSYAANMDNLFPFKFPVKVVDLVNKNQLEELFKKYNPDMTEEEVDEMMEEMQPEQPEQPPQSGLLAQALGS